MRADLDDDNTSGQLGEALLQLLTIPIGIGILDLATNLPDAISNRSLITMAVNDRRVVLGYDDATSRTENLKANLVELEADIRGHDSRASQNGNVLQNRLTTIAESGGLHCT